MRLELSFIHIIILMIFLTILVSYKLRFDAPSGLRNRKKAEEPINFVQKSPNVTKYVLSFVACDSRFEEALNVVKSALTFTKKRLHFVIFADDDLRPKFDRVLKEWIRISNYQLSYELLKINFPEENKSFWMNLFKKCAAQRLFIPELVPHVDAIIYVDTDTLFLGPVDDLWDLFSKFNSTQMCALAFEDERSNVSWYPRFAKHPFYGQLGLNSGVMLMNLTRMREASWDLYVTPTAKKYALEIPWGDQDIINIILSYHPEWVLAMSCRYNYRPDHCRYGAACDEATSRGVLVLHGNRRAFTKEIHGAFASIYRAMDEHRLTDNVTSLINRIDRYITTNNTSDCSSFKETFLKVPRHLAA